MCDCPGCDRLARQIAAMEAKLRQQAQEWQRITGECDELRRQVAEHERAEMRRCAVPSRTTEWRRRKARETTQV